MRTIVADIGNTRIKWGLCDTERVIETVSLAPDQPEAWAEQWKRWSVTSEDRWALASVHQLRTATFAAWLTESGSEIAHIRDHRGIPLSVDLTHPDRVGVDRLLNAVALREAAPAVIVDAGTAVTIDWLDEAGVFRGGAILPGFRLMAESLHAHTSALPLVSPVAVAAQPGQDTSSAIATGIFWAITGAVRSLAAGYTAHVSAPIWLTGGDAPLLKEALGPNVRHRPDLTLEGIRRCAEVLIR